MPNRIIAIGDIHGCASALAAIVDAISPDESDTIVALGDYIDRGPDSRGVVDQLILLADETHLVPLLGNHEAMLLMAREEQEDDLVFWQACGGQATLDSYDGDLANIPDEHLDFFERCGACYEIDTHLFVHANYNPQLDLDRQSEFDLFWHHLEPDLPAPHKSGKIAVVGHTPQLSGEILDVGHLICIDTFCFGGGWLTAMDVRTGRLWQAAADGRMRE